jgi:hypothetical protein
MARPNRSALILAIEAAQVGWRHVPAGLGMGYNKQKMEDERRRAAEKEAAARRATDAQVLEDAERLITAQ